MFKTWSVCSFILQNDNILLLTVSAVWFVTKQKSVYVSWTRKQSCCHGLYAQCVDFRKITACSCSIKLRHAFIPNFKNLKACIYVCAYMSFNCTWIYLLATLRSFGCRKVNANKSLSIRQAADVAICCWREGKKNQTELSKRFCFCSFFCFFFSSQAGFFNKQKEKFQYLKIKFYEHSQDFLWITVLRKGST